MTRTRTYKETKTYKARQIQTNTDKDRPRQNKTDRDRKRQTKRQSNLLPKVLQYTSCFSHMCNILSKTKTNTNTEKKYNTCETGTQIVARSISHYTSHATHTCATNRQGTAPHFAM